MDEKKSLWPVFIMSIIGILLFYFGYKRSLANKTDFWLELVYLIGDIIKFVLMSVGALALGFVTYGVAKIKVERTRALFVLIEETKDWCEKIDAFRENFIKESREINGQFDKHKGHLKNINNNTDFLYNQIKELREFTGIDAAKAQAEAEKAIEASAQQS